MIVRGKHLSVFAIAVFSTMVATAGDFVKTKDGIIVHPDQPFSGNAKEVQLVVMADNIIRVKAVASKEIKQQQSLIIVGSAQPSVKWEVSSTKQIVSLKTSKLTATVNLQTGAV